MQVVAFCAWRQVSLLASLFVSFERCEKRRALLVLSGVRGTVMDSDLACRTQRRKIVERLRGIDACGLVDLTVNDLSRTRRTAQHVHPVGIGEYRGPDDGAPVSQLMESFEASPLVAC